MKHNFKKLISIILATTFLWQQLAWGQTRLPSAVGQTKGAAVLTGVRISPNPLSPSLRLCPTTTHAWRISLRLKSFSLRPRANLERSEPSRGELDPQEFRQRLIQLHSQAHAGNSSNIVGTLYENPGDHKVTVYVDATDLGPGIFIAPLDTPVGTMGPRPLIPHPVEITSEQKEKIQEAKRYKATIKYGDVVNRMLERQPDVLDLRKEVTVDAEELLKESETAKRDWLRRVVPMVLAATEDSHGLEAAQELYPAEATALLNAMREHHNAYKRLRQKAREVTRDLRNRAKRGKVSREDVGQAYDALEPALSMWPRIQEGLRRLKEDLSSLENDELDVEVYVTVVMKGIADDVRRIDFFGYVGIVKGEVFARMYYAAQRRVWHEEVSQFDEAAIKAAGGSRLDEIVRTMYHLGNQAVVLEWEAAFTECVKEKAVELPFEEAMTPYAVGGLGVLFLDAQYRPVEFRYGADGLCLSQDLSVYYNHYRMKEWYRPGHKILIVVPTLSEFANLDQLYAFLSDSFVFREKLSGPPDILLGTVARDGVLHIYQPAFNQTPSEWRKVMGAVIDEETDFMKFQNGLVEKLHRLPSEAEIIISGKGRNHPIFKRARDMRRIIKDGLYQVYGPQVAAPVMDMINEMFGKSLDELRTVSSSEKIPVVNNKIRCLAHAISIYIGECVARYYLRERQYFSRVEIAGFTDTPEGKSIVESLVQEADAFLTGISQEVSEDAVGTKAEQITARLKEALEQHGNWILLRSVLEKTMGGIQPVLESGPVSARAEKFTKPLRDEELPDDKNIRVYAGGMVSEAADIAHALTGQFGALDPVKDSTLRERLQRQYNGVARACAERTLMFAEAIDMDAISQESRELIARAALLFEGASGKGIEEVDRLVEFHYGLDERMKTVALDLLHSEVYEEVRRIRGNRPLVEFLEQVAKEGASADTNSRQVLSRAEGMAVNALDFEKAFYNRTGHLAEICIEKSQVVQMAPGELQRSRSAAECASSI